LCWHRLEREWEEGSRCRCCCVSRCPSSLISEEGHVGGDGGCANGKDSDT